VTEATGNMIIDIGGGTTDIAVVSLSGVVYAQSLRLAGGEMDDAIVLHMKRRTVCSSVSPRRSASSAKSDPRLRCRSRCEWK
jgi:actin-like ATPase involved in cell morphogenesis